MKFPEALESRMYGNPEAILEAKQAQQAREARNGKRRILTAKPNWSEARKRAEALFAPAGDLPSSPGTPSNSGQAGNGKDSA
jgi:hypothetical protein